MLYSFFFQMCAYCFKAILDQNEISWTPRYGCAVIPEKFNLQFMKYTKKCSKL